MDGKCVYLHRRADNNEVMYVGSGISSRPYEVQGRTKIWEATTKKFGYEVEIVGSGLDDDYALMLEAHLIHKFKANGFLVNRKPGFISKFPIYGLGLTNSIRIINNGDGRGLNVDAINASIHGRKDIYSSYMGVKWDRCIDLEGYNLMLELCKMAGTNTSCYGVHFYDSFDRVEFDKIINNNRCMEIFQHYRN